MTRSWRFAAAFLVAAAVLSGALWGDRVAALSGAADQRLQELNEVLTQAKAHYGGEVTYRDLVYASIQGMLRHLDPHTNFLTPEAYRSMRDRQQSSFYGLGILVGIRNGQLTVITPLEGTPASRKGLRPGDVISAIEDEPTERMTLDEAVQKLKGPKDTQVRITIVRPSLDEPFDLAITRAEIPQITVRFAFMLDDETGYIKIDDFSRATSREVADALTLLRGRDMRRLVLDLRNNGGGLLDQAVQVADQLVPKGSKIVETRGRTRDAFQSFRAEGDHPELDMPLVVLVNSGTASAAEILAGAIQDHDVGIIVGTPTWGKGLVQTVYNLPHGAGLALTTAKYYTPSGRLIQRDYSSLINYFRRAHTGNDDPDGEDEREVFHTDLGREVFGGGGIAPDEMVEAPELSRRMQFLLSRNAFFDFGVDLESRTTIEDQGWRPGPETVEEFIDWAAARDLMGEEELRGELQESASRGFALRQIHAEVFNAAFGMEASHRVLLEGDEVVRRARELFGAAEDLLAERAEKLGVRHSAALD